MGGKGAHTVRGGDKGVQMLGGTGVPKKLRRQVCPKVKGESRGRGRMPKSCRRGTGAKTVMGENQKRAQVENSGSHMGTWEAQDGDEKF